MAFFSNDYPERMPLPERIGKEWRFRKAVKASKQAHGQPQFVLVHPDWPSKRASIMAYVDALKWVITNRSEIPAQFNGTTVLSCLLYTSPSPRDQRGSRMPSSA